MTNASVHTRRAPALAAVITIALVATVSGSEAAARKAAGAPVDRALLSGLTWRSIGPASMGGRVAGIALHPVSPYTFYVGLATGGLMKTSDNGVSWDAVFGDQPVASIGAVSLAPSDPNVVWVGTGEANNRNSSSWGNGVYVSDDGGGSWNHRGLEETRHIARIVVHPGDPSTAWVAAMGHLWGYNRERGVFKTTDGGRTWAPALQIDDRVGCTDLVIDPGNPDVLYAAMYHRIRRPWSYTSGGTDGGIYKTSDGGKTWRKLTAGLPGQTGRIGLDVYRSDPRIVYALVESDDGGQGGIGDFHSRAGGVFRSEDAGLTWKRVSDLAPRSFYFTQIRIDPKDDQRIYVLGFLLHVSDDGGRTFSDLGAPLVHIDFHALEIDRNDPNHLLLGSDGGVYASYNRSKSWDFFNNIAAGEFYRITVDNQRPYRVAGGLQDNFNWIGPSATRSKDGITNGDWRSLGGGDGFYNIVDPTDPDIVYAESQEGYAFRLNLRTGQRKPIRPEPKEGSPAFRFHWAAPLLMSHHDPTVLYLAGNRVFRLTERGDRWAAISPDLTTQDPVRTMTVGSGAENHGTIYALAESPLQKGLLWAGTDDGKVWITRDDGGSWTDLTDNLPRPERGMWVSRVEASHFEPGTAYVALDAHTSDIFTPHALMTSDFGRTWKSIASDLPSHGPVKVVREDVRNPNLLFAGTEFGIFASFDRGTTWTKLGSGLPTVAVDDIVVHPRDHDLVIGTHGRSIYILDDIRPLQELTPEVISSPGHLFTIRPAIEFHELPEGAMWSKRIFRGENPPFGAYLNYWIGEYRGGEASFSITDAAGRPVRTLKGSAVPGINRVVWDLQPDKDPMWSYFDTPSGQPRLVRPGEYTVTLSVVGVTQKQPLTIEAVEGWVPE